MKKSRQIVALIVAIATIASLLTASVMSVSAEETLPVITITDDDILLIEKLEALGVIKNDYTAASYVTRGQMAEIVKTYMGIPAETSGSGEKIFNDVSVDHPSYAAISVLRDMEIITGDENNNFNPNNYLNYNEAVVFIINAVGHKYFAIREGGYPTGYMRVAIKHDILDNVNMTNGKAPISLVDVYKMLDAALTAATIIPQYYGDGSVRYTISETDNFLSENYGIRKYRGTITGNEFTNLSAVDTEISREQIKIDRVIYDTPGYRYGHLLGYTVNYYVKKSSNGDEMVYVEEAPKKNSTISVNTEDILTSKVTSSSIYYLTDEDKEEHIDFDAVANVIYNNQLYSDYGTYANIMPTNGYIKALDNDADGVYELLFVYDYTIAVVGSVDTYEEVIYDKITGAVLQWPDELRELNVISAKSQVSTPFATIQKNDVLNIAIGNGAKKAVTIYVSDDTIKGKITGYTSDLGYEINGEYYKKSYNYDSVINSERVFPELAVGSTGTFYLDMNGDIAAYEYGSVDDTASLAVVAGVDYNETSTINSNIRVKLFTEDGEFIEAPLADSVKIDNVRYDTTDIADCDRALSVLCRGYTSGGKYMVYDSYVLRYTLSQDDGITFIDTGAIGGAGNLNEFADHWLVGSNRVGVALLSPSSSSDVASVIAGISSNVVIFTTPVAGELSDETGYQVTNTWKNDRSYANPSNVDGNFAKYTTMMDNLSAYHMGLDDTIMLDVAIIRGGGIKSADIGDETSLCVVTEMTSSVDEDGNETKTLYQGNIALGKLAQTVVVEKNGRETSYTQTQFTASGVVEDGSVIRFGTDDEGYISKISIAAEYDETNDELIPTIKDDGSYIEAYSLYARSDSNIGIANITTYDDKNGYLEFVCGENNLKGKLNTTLTQNLKIYDTSTGKIRDAGPLEILGGDKCVLRLKMYYEICDVIIIR